MSTICVDFDGVIHAYTRGWHDGTIYDPPLPGAFEGLHALMQHAAVVIHTTRDAQQVADWLFERGDFNITWEQAGTPICEFWNDQTRLLVTSRKLPAVAYLDDRAVRFTSWRHAVDETLLAAGLHPDPATAVTTATQAAEQQRRADITDSVTVHAKELLTRRTTTLQQRAERAEAERDGAYRERAQLLAWLAALYPAVRARALDVTEPGWQMLYLDPPNGGQMSWHIAPRDIELFDHVEYVRADDQRALWDGHTTEDKYQRIASLTGLLADLAEATGEPPCTCDHTTRLR
jgi:hypothetical protein